MMLAAIFSDGWTLKNILIVAIGVCVVLSFAAPALWAKLKANALSSLESVIESKLKVDVPDQWFKPSTSGVPAQSSEVDEAIRHVGELVKTAKSQAEIDDLMAYLKKHVSKDQKQS